MFPLLLLGSCNDTNRNPRTTSKHAKHIPWKDTLVGATVILLPVGVTTAIGYAVLQRNFRKSRAEIEGSTHDNADESLLAPKEKPANENEKDNDEYLRQRAVRKSKRRAIRRWDALNSIARIDKDKCYFGPASWILESDTVLHISPSTRQSFIMTTTVEGPESLELAEQALTGFPHREVSIISEFSFLHHAAARKQISQAPRRATRAALSAASQLVDRSDYEAYIFPWSKNIVFERYQRDREESVICQWQHLRSGVREELLKTFGVSVYLFDTDYHALEFKKKDSYVWSVFHTEERLHMVVHRSGWSQQEQYEQVGQCVVISAGADKVQMFCSYRVEYSRKMRDAVLRVQERGQIPIQSVGAELRMKQYQNK